jgi:hypothetical protein
MCVVQVLCVFKGLFCLDAYLIFKDDFEYYCELLITVLIILVGHDGNENWDCDLLQPVSIRFII